VKVGDLVRLRPHHYDRYGNWLTGEAAEKIDNSFGIIIDATPLYYFVKWFDNPLYGNENSIACREEEIEVVSESR